MITYQDVKTVYDLVQNAGREHGDRVFLKYEENEKVFCVTYRQFAEDCDVIATWAREKREKVGHKLKVGLLGISSYHYLAVLLGVMSGGDTGIPLDVQMNAEKLADCLNRSDVDVLFYDWEFHPITDDVRPNCPNVTEYISLQHGKHVPCSDQILKKYAGQKVPSDAKEDECAMILFTSGTTGRGKGVMLSNGNLMDNTFCATDLLNPENEVYLNVLPIHHVFCLNGDVFTVMRYGGVLCLNRDMKKLAEHILLFEPTAMRMVPMMAKTLYNRIAILSRQKPEIPIRKIKEQILGRRLHKIISGGGYLAPDLAKNYQRLGITIAQGYGMSECSPKISSPDWSRPDKVDSVGKIVDRCQVRIVDGEIQVKSPSVMMGYYKEPEKTAEAITEDGWLCTGDLGHVDDEGFLYLTGRKKNLIILSNGENVAPEEIENMFEDDRLIEDILVYGADDRICAEVYPNYKYAEVAGVEDIEKTVSAIVKKHNQELPTFKRILRCTIRETPFAKTSSKKIIRNQYFEGKKLEKQEEQNLRMPETGYQKQIYECVAGVLGHRKFGIDTPLYEAGLDSLGSVLLLTDLYKTIKLSMTLDDLVKHDSVLKLEALASKDDEKHQVDYSVRPVYPLTNLQLYFAYVMRGNTTANLPFLYKLDERVDLRRLKFAVEWLFEIHPELKAIIQMAEGRYQIFRDDKRKIEIPITHLSDEQWEKTRENLLYPYLYGEGENLYHIGIYQTDSANYFFFDLAHIMGDGMTMNVLFEDLNQLYLRKAVEPESYTFYEYILDEKDRDARGLRTKNEEYFQNLMKGFKIRKSILTRPDDYDLEHGIDAVLRGRFRKLSRHQVTAFCKKYSVSENVFFLTAYNLSIGIFSNEDDTVCSSIHSGRTDSRWHRLAGPLFLTYYFRCTPDIDQTVPELLKTSGKQIVNTMRCYISNLHADEMFFQYQGDLLNIGTIGGYPAKREKMQLDALPFHLQVFTDEKGYYYELRYWENRFDRAQLECFMMIMETLMEAMQEETLVRRLKRHLPDKLFPLHYTVTADQLNHTVQRQLLRNVDGKEPLKVYVFDKNCRKKPFGAWGELYVMDYEPETWRDRITNPYGPGMLYQTGYTARILPDGSLDLLENGGRTILQEGLTGRHFLDLYKLESTLCHYPGVERAEAYVRYAEGNKLILTAEVSPAMEAGPAGFDKKTELDIVKIREYLERNCEKSLIPSEIRIVEPSKSDSDDEM